jgi:hypothetical protein
MSTRAKDYTEARERPINRLPSLGGRLKYDHSTMRDGVLILTFADTEDRCFFDGDFPEHDVALSYADAVDVLKTMGMTGG